MISKEPFKSITMFKFFNLRDKSKIIASMQNEKMILSIQNYFCYNHPVLQLSPVSPTHRCFVSASKTFMFSKLGKHKCLLMKQEAPFELFMKIGENISDCCWDRTQ